MTDLTDQISREAAAAQAEILDLKIVEVLKSTDIDIMNVDEIARRCAMISTLNSDVMCLHIDGVPRLNIYPIETIRVPTEDGVTVRFSRKFETL